MGTVHHMTRRGKYARRLDAALWVYIDRVNEWYPPEIAELPIAEQRAVYDAMCRAFHQGHPPGVSASDGLVAAADHDIPVRRYQFAGKTPQAIVIYYHGGGFVLGGLDSHDDICAEICAATGFEVLSADYRLAPEHLHPAAFEDALAVFEWVAATSALPIVLCGESAGGTLAAAVAHATRRHPRRAAGQVLIYPGLGGDETGRSYIEHANAPLLSLGDIDFYRRIRSAPGQSARRSDLFAAQATVISPACRRPSSSQLNATRYRRTARLIATASLPPAARPGGRRSRASCTVSCAPARACRAPARLSWISSRPSLP